VGLLRDRRSGDEKNRCNPFRHARDDMRTLRALHTSSRQLMRFQNGRAPTGFRDAECLR
jgi:hypothetical protein